MAPCDVFLRSIKFSAYCPVAHKDIRRYDDPLHLPRRLLGLTGMNANAPLPDSFDAWQQGYGHIQHNRATRDAVRRIATLLSGRGTIDSPEHGYRLFAAADLLASAAMWVVVHMTYARNVRLDGRALETADFKVSPQGHTGGSLNMVPAYVGYMLANALTGTTRSWLMGQGHCVAAIEAVNALLGNLSAQQRLRYGLSDAGLSQLAQDFYSYAIDPEGMPAVPLGSHVNVHTAGGISEGGYLGFAEVQYVHMPLRGESLAVFLSDGAFEEQRGSDWSPRWWRARDCGSVMPFMILNGRRIEQRTSIVQQGGSDWLANHLRLNGFDPFIIDGHDPAAYACAMLDMESTQQRWQQSEDGLQYPLPMPFAIAQCIKGYGFPGAGLNRAHNLPLPGNPHEDEASRQLFNEGAGRLHVALPRLQAAVAALTQHEAQGRVPERNHPLAVRDVSMLRFPDSEWPAAGQTVSPMQALDDWFVALVQANPHLRVRVGNPDELASNRMGRTLGVLKHRVSRPEYHEAEDVHGAVITALNEEAVVGAALGNKGGLNLVVSYEAFALKMLGALRQDILFARHQRMAGMAPGWLGVPVLLTSHTWENGKNEQSHQDPGLAELLGSEMAETSRVIYPIDANTAIASLETVYCSQGVIAALVVPKQELPVQLDPDQAHLAVQDGVFMLPCAGTPQLQLLAVGAYQWLEARQAATMLNAMGVLVQLGCVLEPARLRQPRDDLEETFVHDDAWVQAHFPPGVPRVIVSHTRPEHMLGVLRRLDDGPRLTRALGYRNRGGTFDTAGMMLANGCNALAIVDAALALLGEAA